MESVHGPTQRHAYCLPQTVTRHCWTDWGWKAAPASHCHERRPFPQSHSSYLLNDLWMSHCFERVNVELMHGPLDILDISTWTHNWSGGCTNWGRPTETDCSITLLWAAAAAASQLTFSNNYTFLHNNYTSTVPVSVFTHSFMHWPNIKV